MVWCHSKETWHSQSARTSTSWGARVIWKKGRLYGRVGSGILKPAAQLLPRRKGVLCGAARKNISTACFAVAVAGSGPADSQSHLSLALWIAVLLNRLMLVGC